MFLVTGARGQVGRHVVRDLLAAGHRVRVLSREPESADFPEQVEAFRGDLTCPSSVEAAVKGVRALFLIATGDEVGIMRLARQAGVRQVVLLSAQAVQNQPGNAIALRHLRAEEVLRRAGVPWTFLRPSAFASNALSWRDTVRDGGVVRMAFPDVPLPVIHPGDVASVAVSVLTGGNHVGQVYPLTGPAPITGAQQVEELGEVLGKTIAFEEISTEQARKEMEQRMSPVVVDALLDAFVRASGQDAVVFPTVENVTGKPARSFTEWARDNLGEFTGS